MFVDMKYLFFLILPVFVRESVYSVFVCELNHAWRAGLARVQCGLQRNSLGAG